MAFGAAALAVLLLVVPEVVLFASPFDPVWMAVVVAPALILGGLAGPRLARLAVEGKTLRQAFAGVGLALLSGLASAVIFTLWVSTSASASAAAEGVRSMAVPTYAFVLTLFALPFYFVATVALFWYWRWKAA